MKTRIGNDIRNVIVLCFLMLMMVWVMAVGFSCGIALTPSNVLLTVELAGEVSKKVKELHKSDAPPGVLDEVHNAITQAHEVIDKHHKAHVRDKQ